MVMVVFAEIRNGFECSCKCNIFVFQIWVQKNSLVFRYLEMHILIRAKRVSNCYMQEKKN